MWVVLRLGRMGGTFSSSSRNCHRPIKSAFSLVFVFLCVILGPNGPLLVKRYGSASFEACLFVASGYDSPEPLPKCTPRWGVNICAPFAFFCTPLCYCEVWSVYSDSVVLLQALARAEFCPLMTGIFNVVDPSRAITLRFTCKP